MDTKFLIGIMVGVLLMATIFTIQINLNPEPKHNTKLKVFIDGNLCRVLREEE